MTTALDLLTTIESALPRLRQLATEGELDGDHYGDIDTAAELLVALVAAFDGDDGGD